MEIAYLERDREEATRVVAWLEEAGHDCHHLDEPAGLLRAFQRQTFDVLLLEWRAAARAAGQLLGRTDSQGQNIPTLATGMPDDESAPAEALRAGADDYTVKPLVRAELLARIDALSRRADARPRARNLWLGPWEVDAAGRRILLDGEPVALTEKDYALACQFLRHPGRVLSRAYLLRTVWGLTGSVNSRTLDVHVSRIRRALEITPSRGFCIRSLYQQGYRLETLDQR